MTAAPHKPTIIFFGTDNYAALVLKSLADAGYRITLVVTKPDEPAGRHQKVTAPPVKHESKKLGLPIWQPDVLDNFEILKKAGGDVYILAAYGKLLPKELIAIPPLGIINIHPSLLPRYRGPSPVQTALINGDKETGATLILLDEKMDHGPILAQKRCIIGAHEAAPQLSERLFLIGAELILNTLPKYAAGLIPPHTQDESQATYCTIIKRGDGRVDWRRSSQEIYNQFRALTPWPGIFTILNFGCGKSVRTKLLEIRINSYRSTCEYASGTIIKNARTMFVACGDGQIEIMRLQLEGGKPMNTEEFLKGHGQSHQKTVHSALKISMPNPSG